MTFGETMGLFRDPLPGMLALSRTVQLGMGGAESNVAIALRRLGTPVTWLGRVGRDSLGDLIRRELAAEGVNAVVIVDDDAPTGLMIKERRMASPTRVWYYRAGSAGSRLKPTDIPADVIGQAGLLHVTGITPALSESAARSTRRAMRIAREAGVLVWFDLNYRLKLWNVATARRTYRDLIALADIVFAGENEAAIAVGAADSVAETARLLSELGPREVIIKLGGARMLCPGRRGQLRAGCLHGHRRRYRGRGRRICCGLSVGTPSRLASGNAPADRSGRWRLRPHGSRRVGGYAAPE